MEKILEISQKLRLFKNFKIALESVSDDILSFTGVDRILILKKEIQEPMPMAALNFFHTSAVKEFKNSYFENSFKKSLNTKDYMSIYSESLISSKPITFNPEHLDPVIDKTIYEYYEGKDVKSCLIIPIVVHNEIWGIVCFHDLVKTRDLGAEIFTEANIICELLINSIIFCDQINKASLESLDEHSYRMASLGKLAASIAHEMSNQIFLINGFASKIEKFLKLHSEYSHDVLINCLASIQNSCNRSTEIVEALRVTTRSTKYEQLEVCDLNFLIFSLLNLSKDKIKKEKIKLEVFSPDKELLIECKPGQVMQVLTNLLNNSVDALMEQESKKFIKILAKIEKDQIIVEFSDSGKTPKEEVIVNMMEPFFTTKPLGKGCGLGLSICKQIMRKFSGDIELDRSKANTTFRLTFPVVIFEENS